MTRRRLAPISGWRAVLLVAWCGFGAACSSPIQHGLDETSANEMATALERAGVPAEKVSAEGGGPGTATFSVRVPSASVPKALEILRSAGLPRQRRPGFAEVYGQPSLIPTPTEERARYVQALSGELERTLEAIDGVIGARVHLVMAEVDPLATDGKPRTPASASVLLRIRDGKTPLPEADVQKLVAAAVPGLDGAAVAVVLARTAAAPEGDGALVAVGPVRVSPGSRSVLVAGAVAAILVLGALAAGLLVTARRLARLERERP